MRPRPFILLALALGLAGSAISLRAQDQPAPTGSSPDKPAQPQEKSPAPAPAADGKQAPEAPSTQAPAPAAASAKSSVKEHKVITNDNLASIVDGQGEGHSNISLNGINDCDRFCFEQVHNTGGYSLLQTADWKHDLLRGIDKVSDDAKWQAALVHLAREKAKFCDLNGEKNDALNNMADPRKVTEEEIAIDEEYDRKFKAAQENLNAAYADVDAVMRGYSGIIVAFMNIQKQRAVSAPCIMPMMWYRPYQPKPDYPGDP